MLEKRICLVLEWQYRAYCTQCAQLLFETKQMMKMEWQHSQSLKKYDFFR